MIANLVFLALAQTNSEPPGPREFTLLPDFNVDGALKCRIDPKFRNTFPNLFQLVLVQGKKVTAIQRINQLQNKVRIRTKEAALSFVRLQTFPNLPPLLRPLTYELISDSSITEAFCFGSLKQAQDMKREPEGSCGVVTGGTGLLPPDVRWINGKWQVTRDCVEFPKPGQRRIVRFIESVDEYGSYSRRVVKSPTAERFRGIRFYYLMRA
jgi:hypothetical protein